jgi:two-component system, LytTR family, response regulator
MNIRTLLVDDEPLALERLKLFLADQPDIEIVGACGDGLQALDAIARLEPQLLFLDIQMPELDGFEVLEALDPEHLPVVIFATAFDQFAIQAFEARALDYLLKPFSKARLLESVARAKEALEARQAHRKLDQMEALLKDLEIRKQRCTRFVVQHNDRALVIPAREVDAIEAEANYMWLYRGKETFALRGTMASLENRLDPAMFLRVHRSWILNVPLVKELGPREGGKTAAFTASGLCVPVSAASKKRLEEALAG